MESLFLYVVSAALLGTLLSVVLTPCSRMSCPECGAPVPWKTRAFGPANLRWNCDACAAPLRFRPVLRRARRVSRNVLVWGVLGAELIGRSVQARLGGSAGGAFLPLPEWSLPLLSVLIVGSCLIPDWVVRAEKES